MTEVNENARLELLRELAVWREFLPELRKHCPKARWFALDCHSLGEPEWENPWEDIVLAAREAEALGQINVCGKNDTAPEGWVVEITDAGYDWIKARDLAGELQQEPVPPTPGNPL